MWYRAELTDVESIPEYRRDNIIRKFYRYIFPFKFRKALRAKIISPMQRQFKKRVSFNDNLYLFIYKRKRRKIVFEIQLAEHYNLNCKGCSHFSPIAEPEFLAADDFERDTKRLGDLIGHECDEIRLMGGEPLLNPEIKKILKIALGNFKKGVISIVTNGILLPQMDDDFWQTCHDNKIYIKISHYPIEIQAEKIKYKLEKFGVKCFWDMLDMKNEFLVYAIDLEGKQDVMKNFMICGHANNCPNLSHGRLYPCPFAAHSHHFNKKFNQDIIVTQQDYIDIYAENITKREILARLAKPMPVCRYCKLVNMARCNGASLNRILTSGCKILLAIELKYVIIKTSGRATDEK